MEEAMTLSDAMMVDRLAAGHLARMQEKFDAFVEVMESRGFRLYVEDRPEGPHISVGFKE